MLNRREIITHDLAADRRRRILDAAEACFVAQGFHRASMQSIAAQAEMSVGNFYRYFKDKDAIVLGLAERDRAEAGHFLKQACAGDGIWTALLRLLRADLVEGRREKAVLLVEIWAEATRNPTIEAMHARFDRENREWLMAALGGVTHLSRADLASVIELLMAQVRGILAGRALSPDYDPIPPFETMVTIVEHRLFGVGTEVVSC